MKILVLPDIHNRIEEAQHVLETYPHDKLIFLGDVFDQFDDNADDAFKTARWFKEQIQKYGDKAVWLLGNHDAPYRFPFNKAMWCPGFEQQKSKAINSVMTQEEWNKIKLCHFQEGHLFSHAGFSKDLFRVEKQYEIENILSESKIAIDYTKNLVYHRFMAWGRSRGGSDRFDGCLWVDWHALNPIEGINQVVGHSHGHEVRFKETENSKNWCLDTGLKYIGILEDSKFRTELVKY